MTLNAKERNALQSVLVTLDSATLAGKRGAPEILAKLSFDAQVALADILNRYDLDLDRRKQKAARNKERHDGKHR